MNSPRPGPSLDAWIEAAASTAPGATTGATAGATGGTGGTANFAAPQDAATQYASAQYGAYEQRLVTGDAVSLALYPTSWMLRCLGGAIDALLMVIIFAVCAWGWATMPQANTAIRQIGAIVTAVLAFVGYPVVMETVTRGRTVGKYVIGARVVRLDGGPITFRHAFARGLMGLVDKIMTLGALALVACMISARTQRVGDMAAGTVVVNTRVKKLYPVQYSTPPHLAEWIRYADIRPIPHHVATRATQLVQRWESLDEASRARLEIDLVTDLSGLVAPPPPLRASPRDVCLAIVGERQRRDMDTLQRTMARRNARRAIARNQEF